MNNYNYNYKNREPTEIEYTFVLIKDRDHSYYHPVLVEQDICNESFIFKNAHLMVCKENTMLNNVIIEPQQKYLIQTKDMGNFGYYSVGNPIHIFENQVEVELDIYHYYFMQFCG